MQPAPPLAWHTRGEKAPKGLPTGRGSGAMNRPGLAWMLGCLAYTRLPIETNSDPVPRIYLIRLLLTPPFVTAHDRLIALQTLALPVLYYQQISVSTETLHLI